MILILGRGQKSTTTSRTVGHRDQTLWWTKCHTCSRQTQPFPSASGCGFASTGHDSSAQPKLHQTSWAGSPGVPAPGSRHCPGFLSRGPGGPPPPRAVPSLPASARSPPDTPLRCVPAETHGPCVNHASRGAPGVRRAWTAASGCIRPHLEIPADVEVLGVPGDTCVGETHCLPPLLQVNALESNWQLLRDARRPITLI